MKKLPFIDNNDLHEEHLQATDQDRLKARLELTECVLYEIGYIRHCNVISCEGGIYYNEEGINFNKRGKNE